MDVRLETCMHCMNKKFDPKRGVVCNLTDDKPTWDFSCPDYERNEARYNDHLAKKKEEEAIQASNNTMGLSKIGIRNGIVAGIIILAAATTWFIWGLTVDIIFFYPIILFVFGMIILIRGIIKQKQQKARTRSSSEILDSID